MSLIIFARLHTSSDRHYFVCDNQTTICYNCHFICVCVVCCRQAGILVAFNGRFLLCSADIVCGIGFKFFEKAAGDGRCGFFIGRRFKNSTGIIVDGCSVCFVPRYPVCSIFYRIACCQSFRFFIVFESSSPWQVKASPQPIILSTICKA